MKAIWGSSLKEDVLNFDCGGSYPKVQGKQKSSNCIFNMGEFYLCKLQLNDVRGKIKAWD